MPTVLRIGPYRFFFYSADGAEPKHVQIEREDNVAKFWLEPVRLQGSVGFRDRELTRLAALVLEYRTQLVSAWNEYFGE